MTRITFYETINPRQNAYPTDLSVIMQWVCLVLRFMFHMDYDTSYHKSAITRKLKYLQTKKVECVYNSSIFSHDLIRRIILSYTKVEVLIRFMNVHYFTLGITGATVGSSGLI